MDINLNNDIDNEEEKTINKDVINSPIDMHEEGIAAKDKERKRNWFTSSTFGIFLMMSILTLVSVGTYAPLKNYIFTRDPTNYQREQFMIVILAIGGVSILLLTIIAFAIPYSSQKEASIVRLFNKIYVEFKFFIWIIFFVACVCISNLIGYHPNNSGFNYTAILYDANWYFYLIGIPITFALYNLIYFSLCYIKHVYYKGFIEGFIKNSILGKLFFYIITSIKKITDGIVDLDTANDSHRKLLMLLGINLIALGVISFSFPFGAILALVYTGFLFNYFVKILDRSRALSEASSQLSKGNFDVVLPEDMGILSPYARNLNNIKEGFKVAVDEEVKSQNMKTQLITNVSHDLKTPLTSIITYVDLLKGENIDNATRKEYIDILDKKSKRLQVLIDDLFEASKASSGNIELHLEKLDVVALLRQTLGELEEKINQSTLQMKVNLPESKATCELDGRRTYRVFENIIGNILKYAMPNSRVYIDAVENDEEISFIFKNISAYEMNFDSSEIMERFTRGDESRNTEGSGLGLSIAKSLVELQKGNLEINIDGDLFKLIVTFPKKG